MDNAYTVSADNDIEIDPFEDDDHSEDMEMGAEEELDGASTEDFNASKAKITVTEEVWD